MVPFAETVAPGVVRPLSTMNLFLWTRHPGSTTRNITSTGIGAGLDGALPEVTDCSPAVTETGYLRMAKLAVILDRWVKENEIHALSLQCWTAMEEYYGIVPCTVMGMMSNALIPNACEVDVLGALSMYVLQLASDSPSAIADWNNNYGADPDRFVLFHCSNFPKSFLKNPEIRYGDIISGTVGVENSYGTTVGRIKSSDFTFLRLSTDDFNGMMRAYTGEGETTDDPLDSFGGYGVAKINNFQGLMHYICEQGFEHHVALNQNLVAEAVYEALDNYLGWDIYFHEV